jgi:hypothetical protein
MEDFLPVWQAIPALYPVPDPTELSELNQWYLAGAAAATSPAYAGAIGRLQLRARRIASFWADFDLLLTPTLAMPPVPLGWDTEPDDPREQFDRAAQFTPFTAAFNVTGQPAVSLPLHWTDEGLPIGVQLVGPPVDPDALVRLDLPQAELRPDRIIGTILYVDSFGNIALNVTREHVNEVGIVPGTQVELDLAGERVYAIAARTFADARPGDIVLYEDSYRNMSVAISGGDAAEMLHARAGQPIRINVGRL